MKKFLALFLCLSIIFTLSLPAFAATNDNSVELYGQEKPNSVWNWNNGSYYFSGVAGMSDLYSNYSFTKANRLKITVNNYHASKKLTVKLLESQTGIDWSVSTVKIEVGKSKTWTVDVNSSSTYILKFYAPSNFDGTITKIS